MPLLATLLEDYERILDPFAGSGRLREIRPDADLLEIEPEFAALGGATVGDALDMPWHDGYFDALCTSPTYGNRMADHHEAKDGSRRNTYRHALDRPLHPNNSGQMQWGDKYRVFHHMAWKECKRVLRPGGRLILNISDHIRKGKRQHVSAWHMNCLFYVGFELDECHVVKTPRNRQGANHHLRVDFENVFVFRRIDDGR